MRVTPLALPRKIHVFLVWLFEAQEHEVKSRPRRSPRAPRLVDSSVYWTPEEAAILFNLWEDGFSAIQAVESLRYRQRRLSEQSDG